MGVVPNIKEVIQISKLISGCGQCGVSIVVISGPGVLYNISETELVYNKVMQNCMVCE